MHKFLNSISKLISIQANLKQIGFTLSIINLPKSVIIDDTKYQQLFLNIVTNSIKYTYKGNINVQVERKNEYIITSITDTGIGIKPSVLSNIFTIFSNPEAKICQASTGIGLGLTIAKKLAISLKGDVNITSVEGKGTSVVFTARYKMPDKRNSICNELMKFSENQILIERTAELPFSLPADLKAVLIVDDTVFNVYAIKAMLNTLKVNRVLEAFNGKQAIEIVKSRASDIAVIFMDINMPEMNGFEAAEEITKFTRGEKMNNIPIVALSAQMDDDYTRKAVECGMCKYSTCIT
jgi:CheY-like chemotaxis protein